MIGHVIGWMVAGLIVGGIARFLMPGRQDMGLLLTMILGIVGALLGGFVGSMLFGPNLTTDPTGTYAVETAWPGWLMSILGGLVVLWGAMALGGRSADRV